VVPFVAFNSDGTLKQAARSGQGGSNDLLPDTTLMDVLRVVKQAHHDWVRSKQGNLSTGVQEGFVRTAVPPHLYWWRAARRQAGTQRLGEKQTGEPLEKK